MAAPDWISTFVEPLERLTIRYMVTGSVASMTYGEPRATMDIDVVLHLERADVPRLLAAFPEESFYRPPEEVVRLETARPTRGHFNLIHLESGFKADFYPAGRDPLHAWALDHRRTIDLGDLTVALAPPEYVILRKLEYYREGQSDKHLRDVAALLATGCVLDREWLQEHLRRMGLESIWDRLVASDEGPTE